MTEFSTDTFVILMFSEVISSCGRERKEKKRNERKMEKKILEKRSLTSGYDMRLASGLGMVLYQNACEKEIFKIDKNKFSLSFCQFLNFFF